MPADRSSDQRRIATVMFADISGFTALSEKLDPEEVTVVMNGAFLRLEAVVFAHGGIVDAYLGDCVKAVFGFSPGIRDPTLHSVSAALEMREALYQYNVEAKLPVPLDIHIGLNTGPVTAMTIGDHADSSLSVFGDTVRLASRLEDVSDRGDIFVGPDTFAAVEHSFEFKSREPVALRPYPQPFAVYELVGKRAQARAVRDSERRHASVLFAELVGVDALIEKLDEGTVTALLGELLAQMAKIVTSFGGHVDKYLGEGIMALFGVPNAIERAPQQAINCAIALRQAIAGFEHERCLPAPLSLHIGINSGLCIAGDIGGRVKRDFTVMGDTVNLAARLKEAAHGGDIFIGPETYRYARDDFSFTPTEPLVLKGKAQPVPAYRVISERVRVHRRAEPGDRRLLSSLVGRDLEVRILREAVHHVDAGVGGIVAVVAEAGIGKSRLLSDVLRAQRDKGEVLLGRSLAIGRTMSFHPFVDLLRHWCGAMEDASSAETLAQLESAMRRLLGDDADEPLPFVARLMGLPLTDEMARRVASIDGEALEHLITKHLGDLLAAIGRRAPTILVFEDLHWADRSSLRLLENLCSLAREVPLLFLLASRPLAPESSDPLLALMASRHSDHYRAINLAPLSPADAERLTANLLNLDEIPPTLRDVIVSRTGGNPFYIEEVVRALVDQGAIEQREEGFRVTSRLDNVELPGTIDEFIMSRVDRLDESAREVLRIASVIGRQFPTRVLARVVPRQHQLFDDLMSLVDRQMIETALDDWAVPVGAPAAPAELDYLFRHALAQEAVYQSLLLRSRKDLHRKVAIAIEESFPDELPKHFASVAHHYRQAEEWAPAEDYLVKAGIVAAGAAASSEALTLFLDARDLYNRLHGEGSGDARHRALIEKHLGLALLNTGRISESIPHFDAASLLLGDAISDNSVRSYLRVAGDFAALLRQLYLSRGKRRPLADVERELEWSDILFNRARAQITSDPTRLFLESISALRRFNELELKHFDQACSIFASGAGMFYYSALSFRIGKRILDVAAKMVRPGNVRDEFPYRSMAFIAAYLTGDWQAASPVPSQLLSDALRAGQFWDANTYIGLYCDLLVRQGKFAAAERQLERLRELCDDYRFHFAGTNYDGMRAICLIEKRVLDDGVAAAERYARGRSEVPLQALGFGTLAKACLLGGDVAGAEKAFENVATLPRPQEIPPWHMSAVAVAQLRLDLIRLRSDPRSRSLQRQAKRSVRRGLSIANRVAVQRAEILRLAAETRWVCGQWRESHKLFERAIDVATHLDCRPELARAYAAAAELLAGSRFDINGLSPAECATRAELLCAEIGLAADAPR